MNEIINNINTKFIFLLTALSLLTIGSFVYGFQYNFVPMVVLALVAKWSTQSKGNLYNDTYILFMLLILALAINIKHIVWLMVCVEILKYIELIYLRLSYVDYKNQVAIYAASTFSMLLYISINALDLQYFREYELISWILLFIWLLTKVFMPLSFGIVKNDHNLIMSDIITKKISVLVFCVSFYKVQFFSLKNIEEILSYALVLLSIYMMIQLRRLQLYDSVRVISLCLFMLVIGNAINIDKEFNFIFNMTSLMPLAVLMLYLNHTTNYQSALVPVLNFSILLYIIFRVNEYIQSGLVGISSNALALSIFLVIAMVQFMRPLYESIELFIKNVHPSIKNDGIKLLIVGLTLAFYHSISRGVI